MHLQHLGFPIAGDDKYGDFALNKLLQTGLKRMFLHAWRLELPHPVTRLPLLLRQTCRRSFNDLSTALAGAAMPKRYDLLVFDWDGT